MPLTIRPTTQEYSPYYQTYIQLVPTGDLIDLLTEAAQETILFLQSLSVEQWEYRYAPNKWSIKEVFIHIIDTERIMSYRALRIARQDQTPLPGFEQDDYILPAKANLRPVASIIEEYQAVRASSIALFKGIVGGEEVWRTRGVASEQVCTPLALACIITGHEIHHKKVVMEHYLQ